MVDEESEGPRRRTYTPPEADEPFTGSLPAIGELVTPGAPSAPPVNPTSALAAPVRSSLTDLEIVVRFQGADAGSTADMMAELERQVNLREEEEEAFEMWANLTRATRGADAEAIVARARIIFDGGDPGPMVEPQPEPELQLVGDDGVSVDGEAEIGQDTGDLETDAPIVEDVLEDVLEDADEVLEEPEDLEPVALQPVAEDETVDQWPLVQEPTAPANEDDLSAEPAHPSEPSGVDGSPGSKHGMSTLGAVAVWLSAVVPVLGLLAGSYFVVRGLGVLETFVALAAGGLLAGVLIAVAAGVATRNGVSSVGAAAATFGSRGNALPGSFLLVIRWAIAAMLVVWGASFVSRVIELSGLWPFDVAVLHPVSTGLIAVLAIVVALLGGKVLTVALWVGAGVGFVGAGFFVWLSAPALTVTADIGLWTAEPLGVIAAGSLVLATLVLLFAPAASDWLQPREGTAPTTIQWIAGGAAVIPTVVLGTYAAWVSVSSPDWLPQLASDPVLIVAQNAPSWYPLPTALAMVVPVLVLAALALRSAGINTVAVGIRVTPRIATLLGALVVALGLAAQVVFVHSLVAYLPHVLYTLGVVVLAWAAIFAVDTVGTPQQRTSGERAWRFGPLLGFVISVGLGWGLLSSTVPWLAWQGYLLPVLASAGLIDLSAAQPGVLVAGTVGALVALVTRVVRARKTAGVLNA